MGTREVVLVGSVPLGSAREVFQSLACLGDRLARVPDGETGSRSTWIMCQRDALARSGGFAPVDAADEPQHSVARPFRLSSAARAQDFQIKSLGYAAWAASSYSDFKSLKEAGSLPSHWRLQVCLPTPLAVVNRMVIQEDQLPAYTLYHDALRREIEAIASAIPPRDLAIQFDIAHEFGFLEGLWTSAIAPSKEVMIGNVSELAAQVPADAELGFHLCYGDFGHKHFTEPKDAGLLVDVAEALIARSGRPVTWIHMPVPRNRTDHNYFAPLARLDDRGSKLFLGLVHMTDGIEGTERRISAASRYRKDFGIATECGWGRRAPETIPALIQLHRSLAG